MYFIRNASRCPVRERLSNFAFLVDEARNAGIGCAHNVAAGFDGTQRCVGKMLPVSGRIAPPTIVGDNGDEIRAFANIIRHKVAVNRFVANSGGRYRLLIG